MNGAHLESMAESRLILSRFDLANDVHSGATQQSFIQADLLDANVFF
jgi:hypothetical protein